MDFETNFGIQQVVEAFLAIAIVGVSTAFILSGILGGGKAFIPLSLIFYSVLPLSMALIGYLTYKVARMIYEREEEENYLDMLSPMLMSILLAIVAINIGFMMIVSSSSGISSIGTVRASYLITILSVALSVSVLMRNFFEKGTG